MNDEEAFVMRALDEALVRLYVATFKAERFMHELEQQEAVYEAQRIIRDARRLAR